MKFIQIIEYRTSRGAEMEAMSEEFRRQSTGEGKANPLSGVITADQEDPGRYVSIIEFESAEAAREASNRPETQEFFGRLSGLMDGPPTFSNLEVVNTWKMP